MNKIVSTNQLYMDLEEVPCRMVRVGNHRLNVIRKPYRQVPVDRLR